MSLKPYLKSNNNAEKLYSDFVLKQFCKYSNKRLIPLEIFHLVI